MTNVRNQIANLTDDQIEAILNGELDSPIRMGFELEFQTINGCEAHELSVECNCESEVNYDKMRREASDHLEENFSKLLAEYLASKASDDVSFVATTLREVMCSEFGSKAFSRIELLSHLGTIPSLSSDKDAEFTAWLDKFDDNRIEYIEEKIFDICDFSETHCTCDEMDDLDKVKEHICLPAGTEVKHDGSVSGAEITSIGANKVADLLEMTRKVFKNNDLGIDEKCSYHLHFSVDGMKHSFGYHIQAEVMRFMSEALHAGQWPSALIDRLDDTRYYQPRVENNEKYSFIYFNRDYGTWEFRIFGNVDTMQNARKCYELAIKAMRHVYQVLEGRVPSLRSLIAEAKQCPKEDVHIADFFSTNRHSLFNSDTSRLVSIAGVLEAMREKAATDIDRDNANVA